MDPLKTEEEQKDFFIPTVAISPTFLDPCLIPLKMNLMF